MFIEYELIIKYLWELSNVERNQQVMVFGAVCRNRTAPVLMDNQSHSYGFYQSHTGTSTAYLAEREGVEPTNPLKDQTVFKTVLLANAVISP